MPDTVSWIELAWVIGCGIGAVAGLWLSWDVILDALAARRARGNGRRQRRRDTAYLGVVLLIGLLVPILAFEAVGIIAMTQPAATRACLTARGQAVAPGQRCVAIAQAHTSPGQVTALLAFVAAALVIDGALVYWRLWRLRQRGPATRGTT